MKKFLLVIMFFSTTVLSSEDVMIDTVMEEYATAIKTWNTKEIANLMHPVALQRFRKTFNDAFAGPQKEMAKSQLLPLFSMTSVEEFESIDNIEAYQRLNDSMSRGAPQLIDMMKSSEFDVVSHQIDGENAVVTYSITFEVRGQKISKDAVQRLKKDGDEWLLMLPSDAEATILNIKNQFQ